MARRCVDVGCGSGAVGLALKDERPDLRVTCVDISADAVDVARANAERLGLDVEFVVGDLLAGLSADAVVSNPPYVEADAQLEPELGFEPRAARCSATSTSASIAEATAVADFVALEIGDRAGSGSRTSFRPRPRSSPTSPASREWSAGRRSRPDFGTIPALDDFGA